MTIRKKLLIAIAVSSCTGFVTGRRVTTISEGQIKAQHALTMAAIEAYRPCEMLYPRVTERDPEGGFFRIWMDRRPTKGELETYFSSAVHDTTDPFDMYPDDTGSEIREVEFFIHSFVGCFDRESSRNSLCCSFKVRTGNAQSLSEVVDWGACDD